MKLKIYKVLELFYKDDNRLVKIKDITYKGYIILIQQLIATQLLIFEHLTKQIIFQYLMKQNISTFYNIIYPLLLTLFNEKEVILKNWLAKFEYGSD